MAAGMTRPLWHFSLASLILFFGLWQGAVSLGLVSDFVLPSPIDVVARIWAMSTRPFAGALLQEHLLSSFLRFFAGFSLAALIGVPVGLMMGRFRLFEEIFTPLFEGYRYVAPLAWVPFAALWFGTGVGGPIMVIFTGAFAPCVVNAYPEDIVVVNLNQGEIISAFATGTGKIAGVWAPNIYTLEARTNSVVLCSGEDAGAFVPGALVARRDFAEANPEMVARYLAVYLRGVNFSATTTTKPLK